MNSVCKRESYLVIGLFLFMALSPRFHADFVSGLGISAGITGIALLSLKRRRANLS